MLKSNFRMQYRIVAVCSMMILAMGCGDDDQGRPQININVGSDSHSTPHQDPPPVCNNDGTCDAGETEANCPSDCKSEEPPKSTCNNDGTCDAGETFEFCPADCPKQEEPPKTELKGTVEICGWSKSSADTSKLLGSFSGTAGGPSAKLNHDMPAASVNGAHLCFKSKEKFVLVGKPIYSDVSVGPYQTATEWLGANGDFELTLYKVSGISQPLCAYVHSSYTENHGSGFPALTDTDGNPLFTDCALQKAAIKQMVEAAKQTP